MAGQRRGGSAGLAAVWSAPAAAKPLPHLSPGLLVLICADVIRPGLDWLLRFAPARHNLATEMARTRDPRRLRRAGRVVRRAGSDCRASSRH